MYSNSPKHPSVRWDGVCVWKEKRTSFWLNNVSHNMDISAGNQEFTDLFTVNLGFLEEYRYSLYLMKNSVYRNILDQIVSKCYRVFWCVTRKDTTHLGFSLGYIALCSILMICAEWMAKWSLLIWLYNEQPEQYKNCLINFWLDFLVQYTVWTFPLSHVLSTFYDIVFILLDSVHLFFAQ